MHTRAEQQTTSVMDVDAGDFVKDQRGILHEVESNSAAGETAAPRSWEIKTTDGLTFGMYDVARYIKKIDLPEGTRSGDRSPI